MTTKKRMIHPDDGGVDYGVTGGVGGYCCCYSVAVGAGNAVTGARHNCDCCSPPVVGHCHAAAAPDPRPSPIPFPDDRSSCCCGDCCSWNCSTRRPALDKNTTRMKQQQRLHCQPIYCYSVREPHPKSGRWNCYHRSAAKWLWKGDAIRRLINGDNNVSLSRNILTALTSKLHQQNRDGEWLQ